MNIVFFGASVTEQLEGYYKFIKENVLFHTHSISRYSFGGCHLDDAGFFNVDKLRGLNPDIVIFEWNTTARGVYDKEISPRDSISDLFFDKNLVRLSSIFARAVSSLDGWNTGASGF